MYHNKQKLPYDCFKRCRQLTKFNPLMILKSKKPHQIRNRRKFPQSDLKMSMKDLQKLLLHIIVKY